MQKTNSPQPKTLPIRRFLKIAAILILALATLGTGIYYQNVEVSKIREKESEKIACLRWLFKNNISAPTTKEALTAGPQADRWEYWAKHFELKDFSLAALDCDKIREEDLHYLGNLPNLQWLQIKTGEKKIKPDCFKCLQNCPKLSAIVLQGPQSANPELLTTLASPNTIKDWMIDGPVDDNSIDILRTQSPDIAYLCCTNATALTEKGYEAIAQFKNLEYLMIATANPIRDESVKHLAKCKSLTDLTLIVTQNGAILASDQTLRKLTSLPKLEKIDLSFTPNMSKEAIQNTAHFPTWNNVRLDCPLIRKLVKEQEEPSHIIIKQILYKALSPKEQSKVPSHNSPAEERKRLSEARATSAGNEKSGTTEPNFIDPLQMIGD